jgi:hypothetical protein
LLALIIILLYRPTAYAAVGYSYTGDWPVDWVVSANLDNETAITEESYVEFTIKNIDTRLYNIKAHTLLMCKQTAGASILDDAAIISGESLLGGTAAISGESADNGSASASAVQILDNNSFILELAESSGDGSTFIYRSAAFTDAKKALEPGARYICELALTVYAVETRTDFVCSVRAAFTMDGSTADDDYFLSDEPDSDIIAGTLPETLPPDGDLNSTSPWVMSATVGYQQTPPVGVGRIIVNFDRAMDTACGFVWLAGQKVNGVWSGGGTSFSVSLGGLGNGTYAWGGRGFKSARGEAGEDFDYTVTVSDGKYRME